jgi:hypothetical protein
MDPSFTACLTNVQLQPRRLRMAAAASVASRSWPGPQARLLHGLHARLRQLQRFVGRRRAESRRPPRPCRARRRRVSAERRRPHPDSPRWFPEEGCSPPHVRDEPRHACGSSTLSDPSRSRRSRGHRLWRALLLKAPRRRLTILDHRRTLRSRPRPRRTVLRARPTGELIVTRRPMRQHSVTIRMQGRGERSSHRRVSPDVTILAIR